jgi:hypothetical protein
MQSAIRSDIVRRELNLDHSKPCGTETNVEILERELLEAIRNDAVTRITIQQQSNGKYRIIVNLSWKSGDYVVTTTRKKAREWVSLDRLILYLREEQKLPLRIYLTLA